MLRPTVFAASWSPMPMSMTIRVQEKQRKAATANYARFVRLGTQHLEKRLSLSAR